jgi:FkbM family methyltransferase
MNKIKSNTTPQSALSYYDEIYAKFPTWEGIVEAGYIARSTGSIARIDRLYPGEDIAILQMEAKEMRLVKTKHPAPTDPNYFELGAILMAVDSARGGFAMMELGAGTGPWTAQAANAAAARQIKIRHFLAVEAEPERFLWLEDNLIKNNVLDSEMDLVHAAVLPKSKHSMKVLFPVGAPLFAGWSAQTNSTAGTERTISYSGRTDRAELKTVPVISMLGLLLRSKHIYDIAHIDIQGSEFDVLEEAAQLLPSRLRAVAIGTHGDTISEKIAELFTKLGWQSMVFIDGNSNYKINDTQVSTVGLDGFQHWINPRL